MADRLVFDTGPLIVFARAGGLDLLGWLRMEAIAPPEVLAELRDGERIGLVPAIPGWLREFPLQRSLDPVALHLLVSGEAAVIQLAIETKTATVVIDEVKGRRAARNAGLTVTGSLGLLGRLKREGLIESARPWVAEFAKIGARFRHALVQEFLSSLGE